MGRVLPQGLTLQHHACSHFSPHHALKPFQTASKHGLVTTAILACATATVDNLDSGEGKQAVWLLIDEMNRADIDRAFGPLFTALAGGEGASMVLDYMEGRPALVLPSRFRIIATVNEYDTRFVNSMSAALRRRFSKVTILPPPNENDGRSSDMEFKTALGQATIRSAAVLGAPLDPVFSGAIIARNEQIRELFGFFRRPGEVGVPLGTAQLIDVLAYFLVFGSRGPDPAIAYEPGTGDALFWKAFDRALVARLIPALETDSTRGRLDQNFSVRFTKTFGALPRTASRLDAFLHGLD